MDWRISKVREGERAIALEAYSLLQRIVKVKC
jgi:hypothetical protein